MATFALEKLRKELFEAPQEFMVAFERNPVGMYQNPIKTDELSEDGVNYIWLESKGSYLQVLGMDNKSVGETISHGLQPINSQYSDIKERTLTSWTKSRMDLILEHDIEEWLMLGSMRASYHSKDKESKKAYRTLLQQWREIIAPIRQQIEGMLLKDWMNANHSAYEHGQGRCEMRLSIWEPTRLDVHGDGEIWVDGAFKLRINLRHFDCISSGKAIKNKTGEDRYCLLYTSPSPRDP